MIRRTITITSPTGLHMRPVGLLSHVASECKSTVEIVHKDRRINAKSVLSILGACICCGDEIELICDGPDEEATMAHLVNLITFEI